MTELTQAQVKRIAELLGFSLNGCMEIQNITLFGQIFDENHSEIICRMMEKLKSDGYSVCIDPSSDDCQFFACKGDWLDDWCYVEDAPSWSAPSLAEVFLQVYGED